VMAAVASASVSQPAYAAPFRRLASVVSFVSDGTRWVAWQAAPNARVTAYDTERGRQREITVPAGCHLESQEVEERAAGAGGRFLLACQDVWRILDVTTGALRSLGAPGGDRGTWSVVGSRYVEGFAFAGGCRQSRKERANDDPCIALYDLATGALTHRPQSQVGDLDRPGAPIICRRLRSKVIAAREAVHDGGILAYADGVFAERVGRGGIRIERCHGGGAFLGVRGDVENIDVRSGILTWDTGHPAEDFQAESVEPGTDINHGNLWRYDLASRRRQTWTLPRIPLVEEHPIPRVLGYSAHTRKAVFWIAARKVGGERDIAVEASSVYTASTR
jgi:hypothetical protein